LHRILTVIPPQADWEETRIRRKAFEIASMARTAGVQTISLPEIVEESTRGERVVPYREKVDNVDFALLLREYLPEARYLINKVTVLLPPEAFREWALSAARHFSHLVLVGGESSKIRYPGPSPLEAIHLLPPGVQAFGITIFHRKEEPRRLLEKTRAGMQGFLSQIVFDLMHFVPVLETYLTLAEKEGLSPARIYVSVAPVSRPKDLEFLEWLGVLIPETLRERFLRHPDAMERISIEVIEGLVEDLKPYAPYVGINMEHVMYNNLALAAYTLHRIQEVIRWTSSSVSPGSIPGANP